MRLEGFPGRKSLHEDFVSFSVEPPRPWGLEVRSPYHGQHLFSTAVSLDVAVVRKGANASGQTADQLGSGMLPICFRLVQGGGPLERIQCLDEGQLSGSTLTGLQAGRYTLTVWATGRRAPDIGPCEVEFEVSGDAVDAVTSAAGQ